MEEAYKAGKVRAIGVFNFYPDRLIDIAHFAGIKPAVDQVETHVFQQQKAARKTVRQTLFFQGEAISSAEEVPRRRIWVYNRGTEKRRNCHDTRR